MEAERIQLGEDRRGNTSERLPCRQGTGATPLGIPYSSSLGTHAPVCVRFLFATRQVAKRKREEVPIKKGHHFFFSSSFF